MRSSIMMREIRAGLEVHIAYITSEVVSAGEGQLTWVGCNASAESTAGGSATQQCPDRANYPDSTRINAKLGSSESDCLQFSEWLTWLKVWAFS